MGRFATASAVLLVALAAVRAAEAMPHDVAEAQGCKPRVEAQASFQCAPSSRGPCSAQDGARKRAIAAWQSQVKGMHGDRFARWSNAYSPTFAIKGGAGSWTYTVSAYPCPRS